jgi:UDPglucose 6-dehydrogenase
MRIAITGTGYVGLVSGTCLADIGHEVICIDKDANKIACLNEGRVPIYEPGLEELIATNVEAGRLRFTTDLASAVACSDAVFVAVGTPARNGDGQADLSYVFSAVREIAKSIRGYTVLVTKSTVPVGTGDVIERILRQERPNGEFSVVSNPEFLREGSAIKDFKEPDRIVIGTEDPRAGAVMAELYEPLSRNQVPVLMSGRRTAELIKYTANAFLAAKITFINEIANLCEKVGADIREVASGIGLDNRIGARFLQAGPGFGGSCFPKDTVALLRIAQDHGVTLRLVEDTVSINDARKRAIARKVVDAVGGSVEGRTIAVLGLTFKPDTDDMREAPSVALIEALQRGGATIRAHDPVGMDQAKKYLDDVAFFDDPYSCVEGADAIVLMTKWESLCSLDLGRLQQLVRRPIFVDMWNAYSADEMEERGFTFLGVGLGVSRERINGSKTPHTSSIELADPAKYPAMISERTSYHRLQNDRNAIICAVEEAFDV